MEEGVEEANEESDEESEAGEAEAEVGADSQPAFTFASASPLYPSWHSEHIVLKPTYALFTVLAIIYAFAATLRAVQFCRGCERTRRIERPDLGIPAPLSTAEDEV